MTGTTIDYPFTVSLYDANNNKITDFTVDKPQVLNYSGDITTGTGYIVVTGKITTTVQKDVLDADGNPTGEKTSENTETPYTSDKINVTFTR